MWLHDYDSFVNDMIVVTKHFQFLEIAYLKSFYMNADINQLLLDYIHYWERNKHEQSDQSDEYLHQLYYNKIN